MKLHFERLGEGPPLVILHGLLGSGDNWMGLAKSWAADFTVLVPDLRNHGRSPHAQDASFGAMAGDVVELIHSEGLSQVLLLGHSLGGKTAMRVALDHPAEIRGLVVVDIAPKPYPPIHRSLLAGLLALNLSQFTTRSEVDSALTATIPDARVRQWLLKNLGRSPEGDFFWKPNLPVLHQNLGELTSGFADLRDSQAPALFVAGGRSDYLGPEDMPLIHQYFPKAMLEKIPEAGHWVHVDAPAKLLDLVTRFANETCQGKS